MVATAWDRKGAKRSGAIRWRRVQSSVSGSTLRGMWKANRGGVVYGQSDIGADVTVRLEDGSHVPVSRLGEIFASEWVSTPQQALLYRSDRPVESQPTKLSVLFARPKFMPKGGVSGE